MVELALLFYYKAMINNETQQDCSLLTVGTGGVSNPAGAKEAKASLARRANKIRKQILDEIRAGYLCGKPLDVLMTTETAANSDEFRRLVADVFSKLLKD